MAAVDQCGSRGVLDEQHRAQVMLGADWKGQMHQCPMCRGELLHAAAKDGIESFFCEQMKNKGLYEACHTVQKMFVEAVSISQRSARNNMDQHPSWSVAAVCDHFVYHEIYTEVAKRLLNSIRELNDTKLGELMPGTSRTQLLLDLTVRPSRR
jgi:hypothetical protein